MHRNSRIVFLAGVMTFAFAGCESHQAKVDALQKQYDDLAAQFHNDCSAEYLKVPPVVSPKCADEDKRVQDAYKRLQDERAKQ
jgi:DnaJ-class molecular chaperone